MKNHDKNQTPEEREEQRRREFLLQTPIENIEFGLLIHSALSRGKYKTVRDLLESSQEQIYRKGKTLGRRHVWRIVQRILEMGFWIPELTEEERSKLDPDDLENAIKRLSEEIT